MERYVQMVNAPIGMEMTPNEFVKVGERTWNLVWMFNSREGLQREMICFPRETERFEADFIKS